MQWRMLQQDTPEDYVIATGVQHSVRDFVTRAAGELGVTIDWQGQGHEERGVVISAPPESAMKPGHCITAIDPRYFRPAEVETLLGDPRKAREKLGWVPTTTFEQLVAEMMAADLSLAKRDAMVSAAGYRTPKNHE
jgi:GDPmannose 4,6-dehydratase